MSSINTDNDKAVSEMNEGEACNCYQPVDLWCGIGPIPCKNCGKPESQHTHLWEN